ncbi:MAG TPA: ABC transporter ATP-binding protein [Candidatus Methylacidiphilales bacterium]
MSEVLIELENVGLKYPLKRPLNGVREHWALRDVSLTLHRGQTLGVIGSNGAGKSTLMKLLAGITQEDRGIVRRKKGLRISILNLGLGFEGTLTGRENAILSGMLFGLHRRTIEKRMENIIEFSELGDFIDQPYYTYSSGMGARLGFAVAMEIHPDILLLDEVLGVGDARFAEKSAKALHEKINSDMTVVLISHDAGTIRRLATTATWIDRGLTQCFGTVDEVSAQYEHFIQTGEKPVLG